MKTEKRGNSILDNGRKIVRKMRKEKNKVKFREEKQDDKLKRKEIYVN